MKYWTVQECCEILDSMRIPITSSDRKSGIYPYYGANGIQDHVEGYIFDDELVLLAEDGGNFGSKERPIAYRVSGKCWVNNHAHVLKPKEVLDVDYLCYSLMFYDTTGIVNGATRQKLTQADMRKMVIPMRSMAEQRDIVQRIKSIECIIHAYRQQLHTLDELIKARFVDLFGDDIKRSALTIGDIAEETTVGIANSATHAYSESGVVMLRNQNIRVNYLDDSDLIYIKQEFAEKYRNKALQKGDILVTRTGANVGMACIVPKKYEGCQTFTTLILRLRKDLHVSPTFVCHYINSPIGKTFVDKNKIGGGQPNFGAKQLATMPIILPSDEKQMEFDLLVEHVDKSKVVVQKALDEAKLLFESLMQKYFG